MQDPQFAKETSGTATSAGPVSLPRTPAARLDVLRREAARCRAAPHLEMIHACALLTLDPERAPIVFARSLLRTLGQALGQRPVFLRPGCAETSFDENWLLSLLDRLQSGDLDSAHFLICRRVPRHHRRALVFLLHGLIADPARAMP